MKQPTPIFQANIVNGKARFTGPEKTALKRWLLTFKTGTLVDIVIRKHSTKRSNEQNAYYFGVVVPILADHFGYDNREDMHEDLKLKFNPIESKIEPGRRIGGTTTKMSTVEFMAAEDSYVERICRWAAEEHELFIPLPEKAE